MNKWNSPQKTQKIQKTQRVETNKQLQRMKFLAQANVAFAVLKADSKSWKEELEERRLWERTLSDGTYG
jgi:hypothetical protein